MKLKNKFPNWLIGKGIFSSLNKLDVPWKELTDKDDFDLDYIGNHSGNKEISALLDNIDEGLPISDTNADRVAKIIYNKYIDNWNKLWEAVTSEYNPVYNNYLQRTEKLTEGARTDTFEKGSETITENLGEKTVTSIKGQQENSTSNTQGQQINSVSTTIGEQINNNSSTTETDTTSKENGKTDEKVENEVSAFNSTTYQDENQSITNNTNEVDTITNEDSTTVGNETIGGRSDSENETIGSRSDSGTETLGSRTDTESVNAVTNSTVNGVREDTNVKGQQVNINEVEQVANVGIRSSQELVTQEFELRLQYNFFDVVYKDIDKVLTLRVY